MKLALWIIPLGFFLNAMVSFSLPSDYDHHRSLAWGFAAALSVIWFTPGLLLAPNFWKPFFALAISGAMGNFFFWLVNHGSVPNPLVLDYFAFNVADLLLAASFLGQLGFLLVVSAKAIKKAYNALKIASSQSIR
jgi:lipoprotein signal peptidase